MEKKKFEVEVAEIKTQVDQSAKASEQLQFLLETETELAVKFSEGLRLLGSYVCNSSVSKMIAQYKDYQSKDYSDDEAVTAVMWNEVRWTSTPSFKVEAAIEKLLAYDPSRKAGYIKFMNNHRFLTITGYLSWCVLTFFAFQYWMSFITADRFLQIFVPAMVAIFYFMLTFGFMKKKNY